jgi:hypothetical protein
MSGVGTFHTPRLFIRRAMSELSGHVAENGRWFSVTDGPSLGHRSVQPSISGRKAAKC